MSTRAIHVSVQSIFAWKLLIQRCPSHQLILYRNSANTVELLLHLVLRQSQLPSRDPIHHVSYKYFQYQEFSHRTLCLLL